MKKKCGWFILCVIMSGVVASIAAAHCEVPCGIYDDKLRVQLISEHITTIEKSMNQIAELGREVPVNTNQLVRWITNKEKHAGEIQHIVSQYFMTQRIKVNTEKYAEKLSLLHRMLVVAMKCKQTVYLDHIQRLRKLLKDFSLLYFN